MKDVIQQNKSRIRAIIKKITGSYNEDLEQDVYIKTWRNMDKYKPDEGKFSSWVSALTVNVCKDYFKSKFYHQNADSAEDEIFENLAEAKPLPEEVLTQKERQKIILKAIDSLPKKMRQVDEFYEFEELSYECIAQKLKEPVGTVKSRLFNARKILAEKLKFLQGD